MLKWLLDLLYPPRCVFCREFLQKTGDTVCQRCRTELSVGFERRLSGEFFDKGLSCFAYQGSVRHSIHRFKFGGQKEYGDTYARFLRDIALEDDEIPGCDIVTAVPTNRKHIRKRGYDHSAILARSTAQMMGKEYLPVFKKLRNTLPMFGLKPEQRRANILGAIGLLCPAEQIRDKRVLIIDDIFTTGATAGECARVLKSQGTEKVYILTVAKTVK